MKKRTVRGYGESKEEKMSWLTNEMMLYGGLGVMACAFLAAVAYFCASRIKAVRLGAQLDAEYGEKQ